MKKSLQIFGSGMSGGGSQGGSEADDNLFSKSTLSVLELIGEGEIVGLVNGAKSIFLNNTPLEESDGTKNFKNFSWEQRTGTLTQQHFADFDSVQTPFTYPGAGQIVAHDAPVTITINESNIDKVKLIISFPSLVKSEGGSVGPTSVQLKIDVRVGLVTHIGPTDKIEGKQRSKYQREYVIDLDKYDPEAQKQIIVTRITPDSASINTVDKMYIASYSLIRSVKLNYPNSALIKVSIDPESFTSIPTRSYHVKGKIVQVPSNYSPESTAENRYSGIWNGDFKPAYSNNPAWVMYDIMTNERYGIGEELSRAGVEINLGDLYQISQVCDQLVDAGYGNNTSERRFQINTVIQTRRDAYKLFSELTSVFRGMSYWASSGIGMTQDVPKPVTMIFNQTNVIDGEFTYSSSARKDRHNVCLVTWNDPKNNYEKTIEYVEDDQLIRALGEIRQVEIVAFGCTSRGQAHRAGRWLLLTEAFESNIVTFKVGIDSALLLPGEVIEIHDSHRVGKRFGGRIKSVNPSGYSVTVDYPVQITSIQAEIDLLAADGSVKKRRITNGSGTHTVLALAPIDGNSGAPLPELAKDAVFTISEPELKTMKARVVNIAQSKDAEGFTITAVQYEESKFASIDNGITVVPENLINFSNLNLAPKNLTFIEELIFLSPGVIGVNLMVKWEGASEKYVIKYRTTPGKYFIQGLGTLIPDGDPSEWISVDTKDRYYKIANLLSETIVDVSVVGITDGKTSGEIIGTHDVIGKTKPPGPPTSLTTETGLRQIVLRWIPPTDLDLEKFIIYRADYVENEGAPSWDEEQATSNSSVIYEHAIVPASSKGAGGKTSFVDYIQAADAKRYYWVVAVDMSGNKSDPNADLGTLGQTSWENSDIIDIMTNAASIIKNTDLYQDLSRGIITDIWGDVAEPLLQEQLDDNAALNLLLDKIENQEVNLRGFLTDTYGRHYSNTTKNINNANEIATEAIRLDTVAVKSAGMIAGYLSTINSRLEDNRAIALKIEELVAGINGSGGRIAQLQSITTDPNSVIIKDLKAIEARLKWNNEQLIGLLQHSVNLTLTKNSAMLSEVDTMRLSYDGTLGQMSANILEAKQVAIDENGAVAQQLHALESEVKGVNGIGGVKAVVAELETASIGYCEINGLVDPTKTNKNLCEAAGGVWKKLAFADALKQVKIEVDTGLKNPDGSPKIEKVTVQQQLTATQKSVNGLLGQYTLKIDTGNRVTGFGIADGLTDPNNPNPGPISLFAVRANWFAISPAANIDQLPSLNDGDVFPFVVDGQGRTLINKALIGEAAIKTFMLDGSVVVVPVVGTGPDASGTNTTWNGNGPLPNNDSIATAMIAIPAPPQGFQQVDSNGNATKSSIVVLASCNMIYGQGGRLTNLDIYFNGNNIGGTAAGADMPMATATVTGIATNVNPGTHTITAVWRGETAQVQVRNLKVIALVVKK